MEFGNAYYGSPGSLALSTIQNVLGPATAGLVPARFLFVICHLSFVIFLLCGLLT
jgi:hypothetical protein